VLGRAVPNDHYQGLRLVYREDSAEPLDPVTSPRFLMELAFHWAICLGTGLVATVVLFILGVRSPGVLGVLWLLLIVSYAFIPVWASISEWKFMVDGKAAASEQAFEHIAWVIRERETPVSRLRVGRIRLGQGASRDYLRCRLGIFQGVISCFPFGHDLYVGWTFWWRLSTVKYWLLVIQRLFHSYTLRQSGLHWILRYDRAKALREAIHSAARQGVDAASGEIEFRGTGTIGTDIPIEDEDPREGFPQWISNRPSAPWSEDPSPSRPGAKD
jgi:hypothetical protein